MNMTIALTALLALVPLFQGDEVVALEIVLNGEQVYSVGDPMLIDEFTGLIAGAGPGQDHKCRDIGEMRFRLADGELRRFGLLPAHEQGVYGLRVYDRQGGYTVVHVDPERLLDLLARAGVPALDDMSA